MNATMQTGIVAQADALRGDLAACLRRMSGEAGPDDEGVEALIAAFLERAGGLQRSFATASLHTAARGGAEEVSGGSGDVAALSVEVEGLRSELAEKEALLAAHRANLQRWVEECESVEQSAAMTVGMDAGELPPPPREPSAENL